MDTLVGLIADTHDNKHMSAKAIELFNQRAVGLVLHAGDFVAPFNSREFARLNADFVGIFGNNDGERFGLKNTFADIGQIVEGPHELEYAGKRLLLMHEPVLLEAAASSGQYDAITYGHTHEVDVRPGKTLIINPGECGGWLNDRTTVAILDLGTMAVEVIDLQASTH